MRPDDDRISTLFLSCLALTSLEDIICVFQKILFHFVCVDIHSVQGGLS